MKIRVGFYLILIAIVGKVYMHFTTNHACEFLSSEIRENKPLLIMQMENFLSSDEVKNYYGTQTIKDLAPEFYLHLTAQMGEPTNLYAFLIEKPHSAIRAENIQFIRIILDRAFLQYREQGESEWPRIANDEVSLEINDNDFQLFCGN